MKVLIFLMLSIPAFAGNDGIHVVAKGETLYNLAKKYGMELDALKRLNHIQDTLYKIKVGDTLKVHSGNPETVIPNAGPAKVTIAKPDPVVESKKDSIFHQVKQGETIYSIVQKFPPMTVPELLKLNKLPSASAIRPGQRLFVGIGVEEVQHKSIADLFKEVVKKEIPTKVTEEKKTNPVATETAPVKVEQKAKQEESIVNKEKEVQVKKEVDPSQVAPQKAVVKPETPIAPAEVEKITAPSKPVEPAKPITEPKPAENSVIQLPQAKTEKKDEVSTYRTASNADSSGLNNAEKLSMMIKFEEENLGNSTKCIAMTIPGSNLNCALYNAAKEGSIIRVRNVKNNKAVYLKVIGKLPNIAKEKEVCIKISDSAAQKLKTDNTKFLVEIEY